jgi:hypothetical protein
MSFGVEDIFVEGEEGLVGEEKIQVFQPKGRFRHKNISTVTGDWRMSTTYVSARK